MNTITYLYENSGKLNKHSWNYPNSPYYVDIKEQIEKGNQLGNLSACVFRGQFLRELPESLFDIPIADWMLGVMMAQKGSLGLLKESTSVYRVNANGVWAGSGRWKKHFVMLRDADIYDTFLNKEYHKEWKRFKQNCWRNVRHNWMHYMPVWVQNIWHKMKYKLKA